MKYNVNEKVVIITGSSMGIGKSLATLLGGKGAKLVINGRDLEKLENARVELTGRGYKVFSFNGDITNEADCRRLVEETLDQFGRIDVLVNNAGVSMRGTIDQLSNQVVSSIFEINAIAPVILTQMVLPHIVKSKGSVVFISSLAGLYGLPFISVYSAAKMSLTAIAEALQIESRLNGIHVGLVYVGITEIEKGKAAIGPTGLPVVLQERKGLFTATKEQVAMKILQNIEKRKKRTVIGISGKFYDFLVRHFPAIVGLILKYKYNKTSKYYQ